MKPLRAHSTPDIGSLGPRALLCAAVMAVALLALFVDLLHDSIARGEQWREAQRTSDLRAPSNAAGTADTAVAQLR